MDKSYATTHHAPTLALPSSGSSRPSDDAKFSLLEEAEEESYAERSACQKIFWGVFYTIASLASLYFFMVAVKLI
ncbi:hypothetical protein PybrP1_012845, partial [[Pythium] brassicae (nom. inval.)]